MTTFVGTIKNPEHTSFGVVYQLVDSENFWNDWTVGIW